MHQRSLALVRLCAPMSTPDLWTRVLVLVLAAAVAVVGIAYAVEHAGEHHSPASQTAVVQEAGASLLAGAVLIDELTDQIAGQHVISQTDQSGAEQVGQVLEPRPADTQSEGIPQDQGHHHGAEHHHVDLDPLGTGAPAVRVGDSTAVTPTAAASRLLLPASLLPYPD